MYSRSSSWQLTLFACALEDALMQLRILSECNNKLRIYKIKADIEEQHCKKYGVVRSVDELHGIDPDNIDSEHYKLSKLKTDRILCTNVLTSTYLDLAVNHHFNTLIHQNREIIENCNNYPMFLNEEVAKNKQISRELKKNLRQQRNRNRSAIYEKNAIVQKLQREIEDTTVYEEVRERYVQHWQLARTEQQAFFIQTTEGVQADTIACYRKKCDEEQRVHNELEQIANIRINDILKDIDAWMTKYEEDMEAIELKIQRRKVDVSHERAKRLEMEKKFAEKEKAINKWKQFKNNRENAHLRNIKMTEAAIAVQAWWRGILVRLALGPYKARNAPKINKKKKKLLRHV